MVLLILKLCIPSSFRPRIILESPTWPVYNLPLRINAILAVVPAVLGRPEEVFGQVSVNKKLKKKILDKIK